VSMRGCGGRGFLDAIRHFTQRSCDEGVCGDWSDIDSSRNMPVELRRLARMARTDAGVETELPFPAFSGLSRFLAGLRVATAVGMECDGSDRCSERDG